MIEVEWLMKAVTCEGCGEVIPCKIVYQEGQQPVYILPQRKWHCFPVRCNGYVRKHWRNWLLCASCQWNEFAHFERPFASWIAPIIQDLVAVQPMQVPAAQVFFMDFVVGPEGIRQAGRHNPPREGEMPLP